MAAQKETIMVLKVDLDCLRCYKKVKKLLCQFPQIHDQIYNEKQNTVIIKVICCSPEKIRDKLCCKGGKSIKSIEILQPKKPPPPADKPPEKPADKPPPDPAPAPPPPAETKPPPPADEPKKDDPPPPPDPAPEPAPAPPPADPKPPEKLKKNGSKNGSKKNGSPKPEPPPEEAPPAKSKDFEPAPEPAKPDPPPQKPDEPDPVPVHQVNPANMCCSECYEGRTTGPCYQGYGYGYGVPPPPPAGGWVYYSDCCPPPPPPPCGYGDYYNYNKYKPGYCVTRCGDYISDENPTACVIM